MDVIPNVETQNDYADALTVEQDLAVSLLLVVANKSVAARLRPARRESGGDESYGGEIPFTPQTLLISSISGAKFRSLEAGQPARIIAVLTAEGDPQLSAGVPFLSTLAASGQLVPDAMTAYTPTWADTINPQPSIGNGTLEGRFIEIGALVYCQVRLIVGSTTVLGGAGAWTFGFPVPLLAGTRPRGIGRILDVSLGGFEDVFWNFNEAATRLNTAAGAEAQIGPSSPFAWAAGDELELSMVYGKS